VQVYGDGGVSSVRRTASRRMGATIYAGPTLVIIKSSLILGQISRWLPPLAAVRQVAGRLTVRESMIFLDGREFTGEPAGSR
jgi:hypothetical protein